MQHLITPILSNVRRYSLLILLLVLSQFLLPSAGYAQNMSFPVREVSSILPASGFSNTTPNVLYIRNDARLTMLANPSSFFAAVKYKSNRTNVRMMINHDFINNPAQAYLYKMMYKLDGSNKPGDSTYNFSVTDSLLVGYNPDSLTAYQDIQIKSYSGLYNAKVTLLQCYDLTTGTPAAVPFASLQKNFSIQLDMQYQAFTKTNYVPADMGLTAGSYYDATRQTLNVSWNPVIKPLLGNVTPAQYELEWNYVDNYAADGSELPITALQYDLKNNATRIITDNTNYNIPLVYPKGYIVYRVRMLRVDSTLYKYPIYGIWSLPNNSGSLNGINSPAYLYKISKPHMNDQMNWQSALTFAEGGKFKHVLGYFDGLLKNRQTLTRFNSDPSHLLVKENIYDYEGRSEISTLPSVVRSDSFTYTKGVSISSASSKPYGPADFDQVPAACPDEVIIPPFTTTSLANLYFSPLNTEQGGAQKYLPQAKGYPFYHTRLSPGYSDRIDKQGAAGDHLQIGMGHETEYQYVNADQPDLNMLFGINAGYKNFYTKTVTKDANGQLSMTLKDYQGHQVAAALMGVSVDTTAIAMVFNDEASSGAKFRSDQLANTTQLVIGHQRIYNGSYYMDMDALSNITYEYVFNPYMVCANPYLGLTVKGSYDYKLTDDCGVQRLHKFNTLGITGVTNSSVPLSASESTNVALTKGKYTIDKTLSIATDDIYAAVDSFFIHKPNCAKTEDQFIRESVERTPFPCPADIDDPCGALRKQMEEELFPQAKYGVYTNNGMVMGTSPSVFDYFKVGENPGYYRYQSPCVLQALNDLVINKYGRTYTQIGTLPVDTFLFLYSGADRYKIAEVLLPLHPEYCRLQNCFVDTFKKRLQAMPDGVTARRYGWFDLNDLVDKDLQLRQKMMQAPISMMHIADSLKTMFGGNMAMDTMASEIAFCSSDDGMAYGDAKRYFHDAIIAKNFPSDQVRNVYFKKLRDLYLANREKYLSIVQTAGGDHCLPCDDMRMSLLQPPLVPVVYNANGSFNMSTTNGLLSLFSGSMQSSLATALNNSNNTITDPNQLQHLQDSVAHVVHQTDSALSYIGVDSIMARLVNCTASAAQKLALKNALIALFTGGQVHNGLFLPEHVRQAMAQASISPDDICNPYLVNYDYYNPGAGQKGTCASSSFYDAARDFLNDNAVMSVLRASANGPYMYTPGSWNTSNLLGQQIDAALPGTGNISIIGHYQPANKLFRLTFRRGALPDTVEIVLRSPVNVTVGGLTEALFQDCTSITFDRVSCYYEDPQASAEGHVGRFLFRASVTRTDILPGSILQTTKSDLLGWNNGKIYMNNAGSTPIAACVPATQFSEYFAAFMDSMKQWNTANPNNYPSDHVFFYKSLRNFMNYSLKRVFSEDQYKRFMSSCVTAEHYNGDIQNNGGYAFLAMSHASFLSFQQNLLQSDNVYLKPSLDMSITGAGTPYLFFDYKDVPFNKVKIVNDKIQAAGGYVNTPILSAGIGLLLLPPGANINTVTQSAACQVTASGTCSVLRNNVSFSYDMYQVDLVSGTRSAVSARINQNLLANNIQAYWLPTYYDGTNEDYFKPEKQALLDYTYGMQGLPATKVLDSLQDFYLHNNISYFNAGAVSYTNPVNPDRVTDLYYANPSSVYPGFNTTQQLLSWIKTTLGSSHAFIPTATNTYTVTSGVPAGASLKLYRCADGLYWYRYFDASNKLYDFYVRIPAFIYESEHPNFNVVAMTPENGDSVSRRFTLSLTLPSAPTDIIYASGSADFDIAWSRKLSDVLLGDEDAQHAADPLSGLPGATPNCEQQLLQNAIYAGKINYINYIDSFRQALKAAFYAHVMLQLNEKLWIDYMDARFAFTLFNYDRAGNLMQTIPPMGVHKLDTGTANNLVDQLRQNNQYASNAIPQHTKVSRYEYNTANKPVREITPDAGLRTMSYDAKGNVILLQDERQRQLGLFTYTLYDAQNRVTETGEVQWGNCPAFADKPLYVKVGSTWQKTVPPNACACENMEDSLWQYCAPDYSSTYNNQDFATAIHKKARTQVVATVYDDELINLGNVTGMSRQTNLRNRVTANMYFESCPPDYSGAAPRSGYNTASHYSYDAAGNVQTLVREIPELDGMGQRYKRIDYEYDLLSGKINLLSYNRGKPDQLYQRYSYDADNRVTKAEISHDGLIWKRDAEYTYYQHGPLARVSLGDLRVQGIDYAYTLQGWLKSINADRNDAALDMGGDNGVSTVTAADVYATALDYFDGDYTPVGSAQFNILNAQGKQLYNGNITRATNDVAPFGALVATYTYDQQNRIRKAQYGTMAANVINFNNWYASAYKYDLDGNLTQLTRRENTGILMDSLQYAYQDPDKNRLSNVLDYAGLNQPALQDIKPYTTPGFTRFLYDENGNIIKDLTSNTDSMQWNIYGKITDLGNKGQNLSMHFLYDAKGDRMAKKQTVATSDGSDETNTYYVRDATGNILAEYNVNKSWGPVASPVPWVKEIRESLPVGPFDGGGWIEGLKSLDYLNKPAFVDYVLSLGTPLDTYPGFYFARDPVATANNLVNTYEAQIAQIDYSKEQKKYPLADAVETATWDHLNTYPIYRITNAMLSDPTHDNRRNNLELMQQNIPELLTQFCTDYGISPDSDPGYILDNMTSVSYSTSYYFTAWFMDVYGKPEGRTVLRNWLRAVTVREDYVWSYGLIDVFRDVENGYCFEAAETEAKAKGIDAGAVGIFAFANWWDRAAGLISMEDKSSITYYDDPFSYLKRLAQGLDISFTDEAVARIPDLDLLRLAGISKVDISTLPIATHWGTPTLKKQSISLAAHHLYGSSRIGINSYWPLQYACNWDFQNNIIDTFGLNVFTPWYSGYYNDLIQPKTTVPNGNELSLATNMQHQLGQKQFELTNHLGNVQATVSDKRFEKDADHDGRRDIFKAGIQAAYDYYPYGMLMPGRFTQDSSAQCMTLTQTKMMPRWVSYLPDWWTTLVPIGDIKWITMPATSTVTVNWIPDGSSFYFPLNAVPGLLNNITFTVTDFSTPIRGTIIYPGEGKPVELTSLIVDGPGTFAFNFTPPGDVIHVLWEKLVPTRPDITFTLTNLQSGKWVYEPQTTYVQICNKANDKYEFGFSGKYKDNEIAGVGNSLDFGARMYNSRLGRWFSIDPLAKNGPAFSPYNYAFNSPIRYNDNNGKWPGVTYFYYEGGVGVGMGYGIYAIAQTGLAYDDVGKTHFEMVNFVHFNNQNLQDGSSNPQLIMGGDAGVSGNWKQDWGNNTFLESIGYNATGWNSPVSLDTRFKISQPSLKAAAGIGFGIGDKYFSLSLGLSAGFKISNIGTSVRESISLTDKEAGIVSDATDVGTESWIVTNKTFDAKANLWHAKVSTLKQNGKMVPTNVSIESANIKDEKGRNTSSGIWASQNYIKEAKQAEK